MAPISDEPTETKLERILRHADSFSRLPILDDRSIDEILAHDDPVAALTGKYARLPLDSDRTRDDDRRANANPT